MENTTNSSMVENKAETITKTSICMLVLTVSLVENILVLVVLKKYFKNRLRTVNSYFIANMSVADVIFAVQNLPLAYNNLMLKGHWVIQGSIGTVLCKIDLFFSLVSMVTANLTILAIAMDRFFAVYVPFRKITRRACFFIIFLTWFISTLIASPMLYYGHLEKQTKNLMTCTLPHEVNKIWYIVLTAILITTLVAMLVLYTAIGVKLRRQTFPGCANQKGITRREKRNRDIFKMLITLIVVFYICSLPVLTLQMSHVLGFYAALKSKHGRFIAVVMLFMNGVLNPIIYFAFNRSFRDGVKAALAKCGCWRRVAYTVDKHMAYRGRTGRGGNDRKISSQL